MPTLPAPQIPMKLRYSQVEQILAGMYDVHAERRSALAARLRLFRARSFPPDVETATTRFAYDLAAVLRLALAFALLDAFVPQELVPPFIEEHWDDIGDAFRDAFALMDRPPGDGSELDEFEFEDSSPILVLRPRNLHAFSLPKDVDASPGTSLRGWIVPSGSISRRLEERGGEMPFGAEIFIDLLRLAAWVRNAIENMRWAAEGEFSEFRKDRPRKASQRNVRPSAKGSDHT